MKAQLLLPIFALQILAIAQPEGTNKGSNGLTPCVNDSICPVGYRCQQTGNGHNSHCVKDPHGPSCYVEGEGCTAGSDCCEGSCNNDNVCVTETCAATTG